MDSRADDTDVLLTANERDEQYLMTHVGELRRLDGALVRHGAGTEALLGWQLALSFALGRWVAPAYRSGWTGTIDAVELWAPWRCNTLRGYQSRWDTHTGDDLKAFVTSYLCAYLDPDRHDEVRTAAMHVITANHSGTTTEGKVMLAHAGLEYLAWVRLLLSERMTPSQFKKLPAAERLTLLLNEAKVDADVPTRELPGAVRSRSQARIRRTVGHSVGS